MTLSHDHLGETTSHSIHSDLTPYLDALFPPFSAAFSTSYRKTSLPESHPQKLNPYAPIDSADLAPLPKALPSEISGNRLAWNTFSFVSISGGVFGFGLVVLAGLAQLASGSLDGSIFFFGFIATVIGMCLAAMGATFVVPIVYAITKANGATQAGYWTGFRIRMFGAVCGFVTGWGCVALPTILFGGSLFGLIAGFVPAVVGAVATTLMLHRMATKANRILETQQDEEPVEYDPTIPLRG